MRVTVDINGLREDEVREIVKAVVNMTPRKRIKKENRETEVEWVMSEKVRNRRCIMDLIRAWDSGVLITVADSDLRK